MKDKINNIKDLVEILENAESNAKDVKEVKHLVGYGEAARLIAPKEISLAKYIENYTQGFEDKWSKAEDKLRDITTDYVKSQCTKTHVLVPREELKELRNDVENARYEQTNVHEEMQGARSTLEEVEYQSDEVNDSLRDLENQLDEWSVHNLPKEEDNQDNK